MERDGPSRCLAVALARPPWLTADGPKVGVKKEAGTLRSHGGESLPLAADSLLSGRANGLSRAIVRYYLVRNFIFTTNPSPPLLSTGDRV